MDEVKSDQETALTKRQENLSCNQLAPWTSRGHSHCCNTPRDVAKQAALTEVIRDKVAHKKRHALGPGPCTSEDSVSEEEATPVLKNNTLKSGKLRTDYSSVLHKVVWSHELVYTTAGQAAVYNDIYTSFHQWLLGGNRG